MPASDVFEERTVVFAPPKSFYTMAVAADGRFLAADESGALALTEDVSDDAMWRRHESRLIHASHPAELAVTRTEAADCVQASANGGEHAGDDAAAHSGENDAVGGEKAVTTCRLQRGPELLPSEYRKHLDQNGWVCMDGILPPDIVAALQRIACTDGFADQSPDRSQRQICQGSALAKAALEPVSVALARHYMQTADIRLAHPPGIGVMTPDDGKRTVQGWHSDYPYHWGITAEGKVPTPSGATVMGVQRIVCVSPFTKHRGATAFKLGSHALEKTPPRTWGIASDAYQPDYRTNHGLPYNGPDADVIEAPAGSMILFDTRTWHRAGINRSDQKRAAILMDLTPAYIVPYSDTTVDYRALVESDGYEELNEREKREWQRLMIHRFLGPAGSRAVIGTHPELTEQLPASRRR